MKKTSLNCVELVRKIRDNIYLETKNMSKNELLKYFSSDESASI